MEPKLSDRLEKMARAGTGGSANVLVRLRAGLKGKPLKDAIRRLEAHVGGAEYLAISGTLHGTLPLADVAEVCAVPGVEWVDVEKSVPVEELIDPM